MLKAINFQRLWVLTYIFIVLAILSGLVTGADEETGLQDNGAIITSLVSIAKWVFIFIELPVILLDFKGFHTFTAYFAVILFDCILYSFVIEMALVRYKKYKSQKNLKKNYQED